MPAELCWIKLHWTLFLEVNAWTGALFVLRTNCTHCQYLGESMKLHPCERVCVCILIDLQASLECSLGTKSHTEAKFSIRIFSSKMQTCIQNMLTFFYMPVIFLCLFSLNPHCFIIKMSNHVRLWREASENWGFGPSRASLKRKAWWQGADGVHDVGAKHGL